MGRSYQEELVELWTTRSHVPASAVSQLSQAALEASAKGLIVVASGGAKVVAEWACRLHRLAFGSPAVALTPLEYASIPASVRSTTWLLSAGGRHPDILRAAQVAKRRADTHVIAIIGQSCSPLENWLRKELATSSVSLSLPDGVDGFLATNSVWAMACTLAQAYSPWLSEPESNQVSGDMLDGVLLWAANGVTALQDMESVEENLVVLHDVWCTLGAQDLEARLIEASLSNVWLADYRNFGHGRHFWIADRSDNTAMIALWTPSTDAMAEKTLDLLPKELSIRRVRVPYSGAIGALASLAWSIHVLPHWAKFRHRDPGRPGVPAFGERLYEGGFPYPTVSLADSVTESLARKILSRISDAATTPVWRAARERARARLRDSIISGIVMDFDGTLIESASRYDPLEPKIGAELCRLLEEGLWIGVATGRGDSVQTSLQSAIPEHLRERVWVGYHNGAYVQQLDENVDGLDGAPADGLLQEACAVLEHELQATGLATMRARTFQLTLSPMPGQTLERVWKMAKECLARHNLNAIGVWLSSHSVDVVAPACSKLHVVSKIAALAGCDPKEVLRIGDRGAWPGNDWRLLNAPLGLSVDECSADIETCWNFNPVGLHGAQATQYLLSRLQRARGEMRLMLDEDAS